jgi:hypothetical protein
MNSLNVVTITDREVEILPWLRAPDAADFEPTQPVRLPRHPSSGGAAGASAQAGAGS